MQFHSLLQFCQNMSDWMYIHEYPHRITKALIFTFGREYHLQLCPFGVVLRTILVCPLNTKLLKGHQFQPLCANFPQGKKEK